jgi:hypothetical protein
VVVCCLNNDSGGMIVYDACPRMNGRNSNVECCVGNIIGTGCYLSESIPILHHKDQSVNVQVHSRCSLQAPNQTTYSTVGTPLKEPDARTRTVTKVHGSK